ncbi:recombinase RecT [Enterobacter hormaechei]|uniref:recombinase RecT n=1 Tax=Enterobacter hormaechei TaxID=158836 RepID=UPI001EED2AFC|nr:recombinase RecT [Enterobacter hormaechei]MCG0490657.1 recombinase RecT [Enterobacter hormaechei]MCG0535031.1 recombinase RecT [Enterobacter hormaechei]MCG0546102.1 recombinase RecT [Enterobacter hormaechei]MCG0550898.1 recombinase RecT [Enterobacter hormaechei]MCG0563352.1 recombinase RecT [Enterobacter hormaechei]
MSFDLIQFVKEQEPLFVGALTDQSLTWAKECQFAIQLFQRNQKLAETAIANPTSAQNAIINVAAVGISLNPASKLAYLVPRDGMVCLDISYMGLLHIAQSAGVIKWGQCKLVHDGDDYETLGLDKAPSHKYNPFATPDDRGAVIGGYCTVKTADGDYLTEEMSLAEIEEIRKVSKAGTSPKGPWVNFWSEMARKTIVKRAYKYWPRAERLDNAVDVLNESEGIYTEPVMPYTPESEIIQSEENAKQELINTIQSLCEDMKQAKNMHALKTHFQAAYKMTVGMHLQQEVQAVYAKCKAKFEEVTQ